MATTIQNAVTQTLPAQQSGKRVIQDMIKTMQPEIKRALPSVITPERFTRIALSALSTNPKLAECTPMSFIGSMMTAAQLGLEPNTPMGQAYLIPRWNGKTRSQECQFQIGYKGLIELAYRSGSLSVIQAHVVRENDDFHFSFGLEPELSHVPAMKDRGSPTHVYALFRTKDGGFGYDVMSWDEVIEHGKTYSKTFANGPWQTNPEEMAKKTALKRVLKYAPMSSDFVRAMAQDGAVKDEISEDMFTVPAVVIDAYEGSEGPQEASNDAE